MDTVTPADETQVADAVRDAAARGASFEILSGASMRTFGRPVEADAVLDLAKLSGIVSYEPDELILVVRAATPLADIEAELAAHRQMLAFAPADWGGLLGRDAGRATLAGIVATNACGARRVKAGPVRDHLIGCRFVNGASVAVKTGGRVVKNVTGFDIPKLVCGAHGTLGALTELTFRVVPAPPCARALALQNCPPADGLRALRQAAGLPVEATGLAYLPAWALAAIPITRNVGLGGGVGVALIRVEGTGAAVADKLTMLRSELTGHDTIVLDDDRTALLFREIDCGGPFDGRGPSDGHDTDIWRLCVPVSDAQAACEASEARAWYADWAGGLLWLGLPATREIADRLRGITARFGGHATLLRANAVARARLDVFEPEPAARAALTCAVKNAFDPARLFNPGRMYQEV